MKQFIIKGNEAGRRLDQYLSRILPKAGTSFLQKMLRKKNITLNKHKAEGSNRLEEGDVIEIFFSDETFEKFAGDFAVNPTDTKDGSGNNSKDREFLRAFNTLKGIKVVYEDDDFIFIDKPVGVLSQKAGPGDVSVNEWLIGRLISEKKYSLSDTFRPAFCNRLDRNTTGLMLGGKTLKALQALSEVLKNRTAHKYYRAELVGKPDSNFDINKKDFTGFEAYLHKDEKTNKVSVYANTEAAVRACGNSARIDRIFTSVRLLELIDNRRMSVEIELHTGKTHQIRAHMAYLGHPIVGDPKYGDFSAKKETGKYQSLHSYRVVFPDLPGFENISGKEFTCP